MIRAANDKDAAALARIYNHYIVNSTATFEIDAISEVEMARRIDAVAAQALPWLIAEDNTGSVVGYAYATRWKERAAYRHSVESTVYVDHAAHGRGWGAQLYAALFEALQALPIHAVMGGITLPNPASVALHESMGMRKVAHFEQVGNKFGQWVDVGYWQRILNLS